jgi:hypothetical protein
MTEAHKLIGTSTCPACDRTLDGATGLTTDNAPEPGDLTVCAYCASFLTFNLDLSHRKLTAEEFSELTEDEQHNIVTARKIVLGNVKQQVIEVAGLERGIFDERTIRVKQTDWIRLVAFLVHKFGDTDHEVLFTREDIEDIDSRLFLTFMEDNAGLRLRLVAKEEAEELMRNNEGLPN